LKTIHQFLEAVACQCPFDLCFLFIDGGSFWLDIGADHAHAEIVAGDLGAEILPEGDARITES